MDDDTPIYSVGESKWTLFRRGNSISPEEMMCDIANMLNALLRPCPECRAWASINEPHKLDCSK